MEISVFGPALQERSWLLPLSHNQRKERPGPFEGCDCGRASGWGRGPGHSDSSRSAGVPLGSGCPGRTGPRSGLGRGGHGNSSRTECPGDARVAQRLGTCLRPRE